MLPQRRRPPKCVWSLRKTSTPSFLSLTAGTFPLPARLTDNRHQAFLSMFKTRPIDVLISFVFFRRFFLCVGRLLVSSLMKSASLSLPPQPAAPLKIFPYLTANVDNMNSQGTFFSNCKLVYSHLLPPRLLLSAIRCIFLPFSSSLWFSPVASLSFPGLDGVFWLW